ncbi:hypothetical protein AB0N97_29920 [Streptomyces collinus]|uniref:hypothetical protein n=1 Tax=Streptomyces collinus TaxID=42684 RepID=UPI00343D520D
MRPNVRAGELERLLTLAVCRRRGRPAVTDSTIGRQRQDSPRGFVATLPAKGTYVIGLPEPTGDAPEEGEPST